jgi:hypothetical protein
MLFKHGYADRQARSKKIFLFAVAVMAKKSKIPSFEADVGVSEK